MAIDTLKKRASVLGIVQPDGTLDQGDRQTVLDIYRGILAIAASSDAAFCITFADKIQLGITVTLVQLDITISMVKLEMTFGEVACQNT
jgi:hypothetical protein